MSQDDTNSHKNTNNYQEEQNLENQAIDKDLRHSMSSDDVISNSLWQNDLSKITNEFETTKEDKKYKSNFDGKQEDSIESKSTLFEQTGHLVKKDVTIPIEVKLYQPSDNEASNINSSTRSSVVKLAMIESDPSFADVSRPKSNNDLYIEENTDKLKDLDEVKDLNDLENLNESLFRLDHKADKLNDILCKTFMTENIDSDSKVDPFKLKVNEMELKDTIEKLLDCKGKTSGVLVSDAGRRRQRLSNKLSSLLNFVAKILPTHVMNTASRSLSVPRLISLQPLAIHNVQTVAQVCQPDVSPFRLTGKCPESLVSDLLAMINGKCQFPPVYLYTTPCQNPECKYEFPILPPRLVDKTAPPNCIERKFVSICKLNCVCREGCLLHVINFLEGIFGCKNSPENISNSRPPSAKVSFDNPSKTRSQESMCPAMVGACGSVSCTQSSSRPIASDACTSTTTRSIVSTQNLACQPPITSTPKSVPEENREPTMCQKWFSMPEGKCHEKKREVLLKPYPSRESRRPSCVNPVCNVAPPKEHACVGPRKENTDCIECKPPNYYGELSHKPCPGVDSKCLQQVLEKRIEQQGKQSR